MAVYHNHHNLTTGRVRVEMGGTLFATCDGTTGDARYIVELLRSTFRDAGGEWQGFILPHPVLPLWRIVTTKQIAPSGFVS